MKQTDDQPLLAPLSCSALFIPLKREFFEGFAARLKRCEYRKYGPRWNERTCFVGRPVVLSLGYGKQNRIEGVIEEVLKVVRVDRVPGWETCYGNHPGPAMGIRIKLQPNVRRHRHRTAGATNAGERSDQHSA